MGEKGFKRKLAAILNTDAKCYSSLAYDSEELMTHNLTTYRFSMTVLAQQCRFNKFCWAVGCDKLLR